MLLVALLLAVSPQATTATPAQPSSAPAVLPKPGLDTPIETLMANPKTKAVIEADLPMIPTHPSYEMFKGMSLNELVPMSDGKMTDELMKKVGADLAAVK